MGDMSAAETMIILAAMAGAVHVLVPDRWFPASVVAWQRGWSYRKTALVGFSAFLVHLIAGAGLYFLFKKAFFALSPNVLFWIVLFLVFGVMVFRLFRFLKFRDVFSSKPRGWWGVLAVFVLLGPCEALIPILIKAGQLGIGYVMPILAFSFGTVLVGLAGVLVGRGFWNRPALLPRWMILSDRGIILVPAFVGLAVGLSAILRLY
jgi:hypothetical protein